MAYIRPRSEELTGYQSGSDYRKSIDFANDFVMVYGIGKDMPRRVAEYRTAGFVVHLMTGIAWGGYQDYLDGKWDGARHWDEGQQDRDGKDIIHRFSDSLKITMQDRQCPFIPHQIDRLPAP